MNANMHLEWLLVGGAAGSTPRSGKARLDHLTEAQRMKLHMGTRYNDGGEGLVDPNTVRELDVAAPRSGNYLYFLVTPVGAPDYHV